MDKIKNNKQIHNLYVSIFSTESICIFLYILKKKKKNHPDQ